MDTLQALFGIATATIFTLTAGLVRTFFCFPFRLLAEYYSRNCLLSRGVTANYSQTSIMCLSLSPSYGLSYWQH